MEPCRVIVLHARSAKSPAVAIDTQEAPGTASPMTTPGLRAASAALPKGSGARGLLVGPGRAGLHGASAPRDPWCPSI